ncbi:MAG TPA: class IV adenylate cyclase [Pyrinomonadaceae bacterium]
MVEIEKKYRLPEGLRPLVVGELKELGAEFVREDFEENTIYGGEVLAETGAVVRIRRADNKAFLTYKRRMEDRSDAKHQLEYETQISDAGAADSIMRELKLRPKLVYEKRRQTWRFRDVEVVIDELPFGLFMEVEGSVTSIKEAEMLLGLEDLETEHETYPMMTARLGVKIGEAIEARFS